MSSEKPVKDDEKKAGTDWEAGRMNTPSIGKGLLGALALGSVDQAQDLTEIEDVIDEKPGKDEDGKDEDGKDEDGKDEDGKDEDGKDEDGKDEDERNN